MEYCQNISQLWLSKGPRFPGKGKGKGKEILLVLTAAFYTLQSDKRMLISYFKYLSPKRAENEAENWYSINSFGYRRLVWMIIHSGPS